MTQMLYQLKGVIFDFDDTLLATFDSRAPCLIQAAKHFGYIISEEQIKRFWGRPFKELIATLIPAMNYGEFYNYYRTVMSKHIPKIHQGALELLRFLHEKRICIAIVSSSSGDLVRQDLEMCNLLSFIDIVQGFEDTKHHKPDERVLLPMLYRLEQKGIFPQHCLGIGDSVRDYLPAKANRIRFVAVLTGADSREDFLKHALAPSCIVNSLAELLEPSFSIQMFYD